MSVEKSDESLGFSNGLTSEFFACGARWLRADFHLHTEKDSQFASVSKNVSFKKCWVDRLEEEGVHLGVVTDHNKFVLEEYKLLRKEATKRNIFILPGIELCVQGGKTGVHILIVFDPDTWIFNKENDDFINRFLDNGFAQTANRESRDAPCEWTLSNTLEELDKHRKNVRDSFVILAHVDESKGAFKELGSGLQTHFNDLFEKSVLAVQKSRSRDNWNNLRQWIKKDWAPARVEGSDCKPLEDVGRAHAEGDGLKRCYLKLGAFTFQAVRLALLMKEHRVSEELPGPSSGQIRSVSFRGGLLDNQTLFLSPDMNNFIGIRGSGKSSILECLRYLLHIDLTHSDEDTGYKDQLVQRTLGSGGSISAEVTTADKKIYRFERILGDSSKVSIDGENIPDLRPQSLLRVRYFGQKDLAKFSEKKFRQDLIDRFTERKGKKEEEIQQVRHRIEQRLISIAQDTSYLDTMEEVKSELAAVNESLKKFEEQNLQDKLNAQIALESDAKEAEEIVSLQKDAIHSLTRWQEDYEPVIDRHLVQKSSSGNEVFEQVKEGLKQFAQTLDKLKDVLAELANVHNDTVKAQDKLKEFFDSRKEDFAQIRRSLQLEGELNPDTYVELTRKKKVLKAKLSELQNIQNRKESAQRELLKDLMSLQSLWHEEFQERRQEIDKLNKGTSQVTIRLGFKEDKDSFVDHLSAWTSGIQKRTLQKICDVFSDGIELYRDLFGDSHRLTDEAGLNQTQIARLYDALAQNLKSIATFRPEHNVEILYKDKPLHEHSLGQRATALMLFLLSQEDFDTLIIDQPEDDLDNQTIYTEVIQRLLDSKGKHQIIFATHSPNIPVLGDAEQIFRCDFSPDTIELMSGSIDSPEMQREVVKVMEGGEEALKKRKQIYESWKH